MMAGLSSLPSSAKKEEKRCQSWTSSDKTSCIRTCWTYLTVCILIDFPLQINTIRMGLSIIYLKGSQVESFKKIMYFSP